ncbi:MAG: hypothetical protein WCL39_14120 [Armatimonadota bacterium]
MNKYEKSLLASTYRNSLPIIMARALQWSALMTPTHLSIPLQEQYSV